MAPPDDPSDYELIREFQAGREEAFNRLVLRYRKRIYATAAGILGDAYDADDVAQEVFIRAYSNLNDFRGDSSFYTWIYRITVNFCLNRIRTTKARPRVDIAELEMLLPSSDTADEPVETKELAKKIRAAIAELPEKQRAVFILRHYHELPHAEIALIMNRDVGTIKANYFQAVRKLREKLGNYFRIDE